MACDERENVHPCLRDRIGTNRRQKDKTGHTFVVARTAKDIPQSSMRMVDLYIGHEKILLHKGQMKD